MVRIILVVLACALTTSANVKAQSSALDAAAATMGTAGLRSLQYTATGQAFVLGQPPTASEAWPVRPIKSYQVYIDYGSNSMRVEQVLTMPTPQPRGGGAPFVGEQRQVQFVRGAFAWNEGPPAAGAQEPSVQPQPGGGRRANPLDVGSVAAGSDQGCSRQCDESEASPMAQSSPSPLEAATRWSRSSTR